MNELKKARANLGLTQEEAAEHIGISISLLSKMEQGVRTPSVSTAKKIGTAMDLPWTIFFEDEITKRDRKEAVK